MKMAQARSVIRLTLLRKKVIQLFLKEKIDINVTCYAILFNQS